MKYPYVYLKFVWRQLEFAFFGALASVGALFIFSNFGGHTMGLLGKTLGLAGVAVGGIAAAKGLLGSKKRQLAELDTEFAKTTKNYRAEKSKLESKSSTGNIRAIKKLEALEREYFVKKAEYENKRLTLLPPKSKIEEERESKEFEQRLDIEKAKALHEMDIEKSKVIYDLELEKDKNHHGWDVEKAKTMHSLELDRAKNHHEWDLEKSESIHNMEMEKIKLTSELGISSTGIPFANNLVCSNCGNKNATGCKFCGNCGTPLNIKRFCSNCGASLETNSKFCSMCGREIE